MNAHELDEWIDNSPYTEREAVIQLLRQQQAEIEAAIELVRMLQEEREALKTKLAKYTQQGGSTPCKYTEGM